MQDGRRESCRPESLREVDVSPPWKNNEKHVPKMTELVVLSASVIDDNFLNKFIVDKVNSDLGRHATDPIRICS